MLIRYSGVGPRSAVCAWLAVLLLAIAGCAGLAQPWEAPEVMVTSLRPEHIGLDEQSLLVGLRIKNPNDRTLPINAMTYKLAGGRPDRTGRRQAGAADPGLRRGICRGLGHWQRGDLAAQIAGACAAIAPVAIQNHGHPDGRRCRPAPLPLYGRDGSAETSTHGIVLICESAVTTTAISPTGCPNWCVCSLNFGRLTDR